MTTPADRRAIVAVDLGAQSCRVSLLRWLPDGPSLQLVHRVTNAPVEIGDHLHWNLSLLCTAADEGMRRCAAIATEGIAAVGVTGWAVDYVRLNGNFAAASSGSGRPKPMADPFCYRDMRTNSAMEALHAKIPADRLYALTGIQVLPINTLYQLYADGIAGIPANLPWLNLPEYLLYRWGAKPVAEYTNATHTSLVSLGKQQWSQEIFDAAGLDISAAPAIVAPGSIVGRLQGPLAELPSLRNTLLIAPACHDTASAIAGIHAHGDDWAFISSGTWSLVGTVLDHPCAGPESARLNFTNEGGVGGTTCFLRNVNGLWLQDQCMASWKADGERRTVEELIDAATMLPSPQALIDVDDPQLIAPGTNARAHRHATGKCWRLRKAVSHVAASDDQPDSSQPRRTLCRRHTSDRGTHGEAVSTALYCWRWQPKSFIEPPHTRSDSIGAAVWSTRKLHPWQCFHPTRRPGKTASRLGRRVSWECGTTGGGSRGSLFLGRHPNRYTNAIP